MEHGLINMLTSSLFWLMILLSAVLTTGLALMRRRDRKFKFYDLMLPVWVALNVIVTTVPLTSFIGLDGLIALTIGFTINGLIQYAEVRSYHIKEAARHEATTDDETKEVA